MKKLALLLLAASSAFSEYDVIRLTPAETAELLTLRAPIHNLERQITELTAHLAVAREKLSTGSARVKHMHGIVADGKDWCTSLAPTQTTSTGDISITRASSINNLSNAASPGAALVCRPSWDFDREFTLLIKAH